MKLTTNQHKRSSRFDMAGLRILWPRKYELYRLDYLFTVICNVKPFLGKKIAIVGKELGGEEITIRNLLRYSSTQETLSPGGLNDFEVIAKCRDFYEKQIKPPIEIDKWNKIGEAIFGDLQNWKFECPYCNTKLSYNHFLQSMFGKYCNYCGFGSEYPPQIKHKVVRTIDEDGKIRRFFPFFRQELDYRPRFFYD